MSKSPSLGHADARPRVHIWQHGLSGRFRWSMGPMGNRSMEQFTTIGAAVDAAFSRLAPGRPAVVIFEGTGP